MFWVSSTCPSFFLCPDGKQVLDIGEFTADDPLSCRGHTLQSGLADERSRREPDCLGGGEHTSEVAQEELSLLCFFEYGGYVVDPLQCVGDDGPLEYERLNFGHSLTVDTGAEVIQRMT